MKMYIYNNKTNKQQSVVAAGNDGVANLSL